MRKVNRIKFWLRYIGQTQGALSKYVGVTKQAVSYWLRHISPKDKNAEKCLEFINKHLPDGDRKLTIADLISII